MNNGNCAWIILVLIVIFFACGNGNCGCMNNCGCTNSCGSWNNNNNCGCTNSSCDCGC